MLVNGCFLSKTANFCPKWLQFLLASLDGPAVRGGRHAVHLSEVVDEVRIRANPHLLQHLLHGQKRGPQHLLSLAHPVFFEILRGTYSRFLLEEMAETRRREIHERGQCRTVPRRRGFTFYF